ncbi:hypothetical protein [Streptomyces sp. KL116D]|uniref:hypothetical protein n=1 Tax=Streptomyces sp. KL116D TaxID=3045152 RepID=UPI0035570E48
MAVVIGRHVMTPVANADEVADWAARATVRTAAPVRIARAVTNDVDTDRADVTERGMTAPIAEPSEPCEYSHAGLGPARPGPC